MCQAARRMSRCSAMASLANISRSWSGGPGPAPSRCRRKASTMRACTALRTRIAAIQALRFCWAGVSGSKRDAPRTRRVLVVARLRLRASGFLGCCVTELCMNWSWVGKKSHRIIPLSYSDARAFVRRWRMSLSRVTRRRYSSASEMVFHEAAFIARTLRDQVALVRQGPTGDVRP
jgi:hypothetical protein